MNIPILGSTNPFAKFFRFGRLQDSNIKDEVVKKSNSQGYSQEELDFGFATYWNYGIGEPDNAGYGMSSISIQFDQYFRAKAQRIYKYREMSYYPDINDGLDMICDEAMVENSQTGDYLELYLKDEVPEHIEEQLRDHWNYLIHNVFSLNDTGWDLFRRWLVDGELYLELILDDEGENIIDFKVLPPQTVTPVYDDTEIIGYVQTPSFTYGVNDGGASGNVDNAGYGDNTERSDDYSGHENTVNDEVRFDKNQVVYINYGETGRNKLDVRGFLESNIRIYNQLKYLEDAVVVYRIVRAPERRIWNVNVGKMPKGKAEQHIRGLIQRYRKNVYYDPSTGAMDSSRNFQAMTEDFWFAKDENGEGTSVDTLAGGCLAMDTKVSLLDGRELSISEIKDEIDMGKKLWTYSCHPETGEVVPGLISWAGVTQKSAKVMKLTLDNGEHIICTYDHKFPMYDRGFVRADEITVDDSLIPLYRRTQKISSYTNEYEQFFDNNDKQWKYTHRVVSDMLKDCEVEYHTYDENISNGQYGVRHHKDFNRFNNSPDNLVFMSWDDHKKLHQDIGFPPNVGTIAAKNKLLYLKENDIDAYNAWCETISYNSKKFWRELTDEEYHQMCDKLSVAVSEYIDGLSNYDRIKRAETSRANFKIGSEVFHHKMKTDKDFYNYVISKRKQYWTDDIKAKKAEETSFYAKKRWNDCGEELRTNHRLLQKVEFSHDILKFIIDLVKGKTTHEFTIKMVVDALNSSHIMLSELERLNCNKSVPNWDIDDGYTVTLVKKCVNQFGYESWVDFRKKESIHNHRVVKIEYLENPIEVGTLTIDNDELYHNFHTFALSCGVFTKNSQLGEMNDVYYFERKLHQNMKIPRNRWGGANDDVSDVYTSGKSGEITREEIKFSRFVNRLQKRFSSMFMEAYLTQLRLNGFDDKYIDENLYRIQFTQSNLWKQYKELEILEARFGILGAIETYIYKPEENDNGPFSMDFVLKNWFLMTNEEFEENKKSLDKEKEAARLAMRDIGFNNNKEGGDEFGGEAGGGDEFGGEGGDEFGGGMGGDMGGDEFGGGGDEFGGEADAGGDDMGGGDEFGAAEGETGEFDEA